MLQAPIAKRIKSLGLIISKRQVGSKGIPLYAYPAYIEQQALPNQGFKIHISATFINAQEIFDKIIPYLLEQHIAFKVVAASELLRLLNEDRFGYTQVGKFITVYPRSVSHFVELIYKLDKRLINLDAPIIPSDIRFHANSIVYYRYGVIGNPNNELVLPNGDTIKDERKPNAPIPIWIDDPLQNNRTLQNSSPSKLLLDRYILLKILRQRAKGLVAIALDIKNSSNNLPKILILKEARKLGALNDQGLDATDRLAKEFALMKEVAKLGICPKPIEFVKQEGQAFMTMDFWGKRSLSTALLEKEAPSKGKLIRICLEVAKKLAKLHAQGVYFFDMSPDNILLNDRNEGLISDFEYALHGDLSNFEGWEVGTPGFSPQPALWETIKAPFTQKLVYKDIFALGNIILAIFNRGWYSDMLEARHLPFVDWDIQKPLSKLPKAVQRICYKTNLLSEEKYASIAEFIQDLQTLASYGSQGQNTGTQ